MRLRTLVIGVVLSLANTARAEPADADVERWRAAGIAAYERGDHRAALENFQRVYDVTRDATSLYAMAQSERALGHCERAVPLFERFIGNVENEQQKDAARANIERCQAELATVPEGTAETRGPATSARVAEDGAKVGTSGTVTPAPSASASTTTTTSRQRRPEPTKPQATEEGLHIDALAGTLMATGVALGAVGTVLFLQAGREEEDARRIARDPERGDYQSNIDDFRAINQKRSTARLLTVAGGLLVGFGVFRYVTSTGDTAQLTVSPSGALAEFTGAF